MVCTPTMNDRDRHEQLRQEFNAWAARGKGASMGRHHRGITEKALARLALQPGDRVLDLGCGSGWATRLMAAQVAPGGTAVGVDISDAMIAEAERESAGVPNVRFVACGAEAIPGPAGQFTHVLSVESFYYYADQGRVLEELHRVLRPGGRLALLMCLYVGHPAAARWAQELKVPVHMRSPEEYRAMLTEAGWQEATTETFEPAAGQGEPDPHEYALLVMARRSG